VVEGSGEGGGGRGRGKRLTKTQTGSEVILMAKVVMVGDGMIHEHAPMKVLSRKLRCDTGFALS